MRVTIEISDEQRVQLLEIAWHRGEKGFSKLVQEAIEEYLAEVAGEEKHVSVALAILGTLSEADAEQLAESVRKARKSWR